MITMIMMKTMRKSLMSLERRTKKKMKMMMITSMTKRAMMMTTTMMKEMRMFLSDVSKEDDRQKPHKISLMLLSLIQGRTTLVCPCRLKMLGSSLDIWVEIQENHRSMRTGL